MPSFDGGDDFVWIGGPGEGLWVVVGLVEEAVDGDLEVDNGAEDAAFQAPVPPIYLIRGASRTPTGPPALVMAPSSL